MSEVIERVAKGACWAAVCDCEGIGRIRAGCRDATLRMSHKEASQLAEVLLHVLKSSAINAPATAVAARKAKS